MSDDCDGNQGQGAAREALDQQRLSRLVDALPLFSGLLSPDGYLEQTQPPTTASFLWDLPFFAYDHESEMQIIDLCERAAAGEPVQLERRYRKAQEGAADIYARGLLTISPFHDEKGHVDTLAVTLLDCDDHGLGQPDGLVRSRLTETNRRIETLLDLAQMIIEASIPDQPVENLPDDWRDQLTRRLDTLTGVIDIVSDPDAMNWPIAGLIDRMLARLPVSLDPERLRIHTMEGQIPMAHVPLLAVLLSELRANALQFGAWRVPGMGRVTVKSALITCREGPVLRLQWKEEGRPSIPAIMGRGFGFTLAERLFPQVTGGRADLINAEDGLTWTFELPVDPDVSEVASDFGYDGGQT